MTTLESLLQAILTTLTAASISATRNPEFAVDMAMGDIFVAVRDGKEVSLEQALGEDGGIHLRQVDVELYVANPQSGTLDAAYDAASMTLRDALSNFSHPSLMYSRLQSEDRLWEVNEGGSPVKAGSFPFLIEYHTETAF